MKEQEGLTETVQSAYSKSMTDGPGVSLETTETAEKPLQRGQEVNNSAKEEARKEWERQQLIIDRQARKLAAEGKRPVGGGATEISKEAVSDPRLLEEIDFINRLNQSAAGMEREDIEVLKDSLKRIHEYGEKVPLDQKKLLEDRILDLIYKQTKEDREGAKQQAREAREGRQERRDEFSDLLEQARLYRDQERNLRDKLNKGGVTEEEINELRNKLDAARPALIEGIEKGLENSPTVESPYFSHNLLEAAGIVKETREMLINRILFKPYEDRTERGDYEIDLYASEKLKTLLEYTRRADPDRYYELLKIKTAAMLFHSMNARILAGSLEEFIRTSERIDTKHFVAMNKINGVGQVMRLYEQKYQEMLARDKKIFDYPGVQEAVRKAFLEINDKGLVGSEFTKERTANGAGKLSDWEIERALNVGRIFFNLSFRAAELIASGQVPAEAEKDKKDKDKIIREAMDPEKRFASFPMESAVRLMNYSQWLCWRFKVGEALGGMEWYKMVKKNLYDFRREKGVKLGKNEIKEFGGMNVEEFEAGELFGISGIYSGWRMENLAFKKIKIALPDGHQGTLRELVDMILKAKESKDLTEKAQAPVLLNYLIDNLDIGLGMLINNPLFTGKDGYEARKRLWGRIAEKNIPLMINYLTNLKMADGNQIKSFEAIAKEFGGVNIEKFRRKILLKQEIGIREAAGLSDKKELEKDDKLTDEEERLKEAVIAEGKKLAPHLADIVFPYTPFMNDIPFENLDYNGPGEEYYRRRVSSDFGGFYQAHQAFSTLMNNPGGIGIEEGLKQLKAMEAGIAGPNGHEAAQKSLYPVFKTQIDFIEIPPGERQAVFHAIKTELQKPTSLAQKWSGPEADAFTEAQTKKFIEDAAKAGIVNWELATRLKKKKKADFKGLLWSMIRDLFWVPIVTGGINFSNALRKEK